MDINRFIKDAVAGDGLTRSLKGFEPVTGFMVSAHKGYEHKTPVLSAHVIYRWLSRAWPVLNVPGRYVGVWKDSGVWYLDVATNVQDEQEAIALARENNQLAYWNISTQSAVYCDKVGL